MALTRDAIALATEIVSNQLGSEALLYIQEAPEKIASICKNNDYTIFKAQVDFGKALDNRISTLNEALKSMGASTFKLCDVTSSFLEKQKRLNDQA